MQTQIQNGGQRACLVKTREYSCIISQIAGQILSLKTSSYHMETYGDIWCDSTSLELGDIIAIHNEMMIEEAAKELNDIWNECQASNTTNDDDCEETVDEDVRDDIDHEDEGTQADEDSVLQPYSYTKRANEFTSEIFKIEIANLPKFFGYKVRILYIYYMFSCAY